MAFASNDAPIGIFDPGFGGLTVAGAVLDRLPNEPIRSLGDTARQPYGPRPIAEVGRYALECPDRLVDEGVKILVIACNSASAAMLRDARERYGVPVVEVIKPATRRAAPDHQFLTTGDPAQFRDVGRRFLGPELAHVDALGALT
ncbi:glutamate racemase [Embleya sp. NPDC008237]|uniref:glutamate racemase n=1 Tax=Embleya sp. NPDC008237 TaxID=3363978 RepID=UPI0036E1A3E1